MRKESPEQRRERFMNLAKATLTAAYSGEEHSVSQAIASYNELDRARNQIHEKLEEWYGIFFPELKLANQVTYAKFVIAFGADKKAAEAESLSKIVGNAAEQIHKIAQESIGREPTADEYEMLKVLAGLEINVAEAQEGLDRYLEVSTKKLMPNITYLIDYKVAAELLGRAGSLSRLAYMPAGTIQLLGAEKALFKHIKFGSKPPKYGSIFKLQQVGGAGRYDRGRIARIYAGKLAIAARADGISKNFIADKLKEQLDKAVKMQSKNRPPKTDGSGKGYRPDSRRQGRFGGDRQRRQFKGG